MKPMLQDIPCNEHIAAVIGEGPTLQIFAGDAGFHAPQRRIIEPVRARSLDSCAQCGPRQASTHAHTLPPVRDDPGEYLNQRACARRRLASNAPIRVAQLGEEMQVATKLILMPNRHDPYSSEKAPKWRKEPQNTQKLTRSCARF